MSKSRLLVRLLILGLSLFLMVRLIVGQSSFSLNAGDYVEYWASCRILLRGDNPYNPSALLELEKRAGWTGDTALIPFNPPSTIILALPFSLLPFGASRLAWFLFNFYLLIVSSGWAWRTYGGSPQLRWVGWLCAFLFIPATAALDYGQMSPLVLAGIVLFLTALERQQGFSAGTSMVMVAAKPHIAVTFLLFLALWILRNRRWDVVFGAAAALALTLLAPLVLNPFVYQHYLQALKSGDGPGTWLTPTWTVALRELFPGLGNWHFLLSTAAGIVIGIILWMRWRKGFIWEQRLPAILLISTITAAYAWTFDWVVLMPVAIVMLINWRGKGKRGVLSLAGLILIQLILIFQSLMHVSNFYTLWFPPALAVLCWFSGALLH